MKKLALYGFVFAGLLATANAAENAVPSMYWDSNEVIAPLNAKSDSSHTKEKAVWRNEDEASRKPAAATKAKFDGDLGW